MLWTGRGRVREAGGKPLREPLGSEVICALCLATCAHRFENTFRTLSVIPPTVFQRTSSQARAIQRTNCTQTSTTAIMLAATRRQRARAANDTGEQALLVTRKNGWIDTLYDARSEAVCRSAALADDGLVAVLEAAHEVVRVGERARAGHLRVGV